MTLRAQDCDWLKPAMESLESAHRAGRLAHAIMIHADAGCGGELLAEWAAGLVLPGSDTGKFQPDLYHVGPTEESKQIRVDDVRAFIAELTLTAHGQGYRVGIVSPAETLNVAAANAFLKSLEEPPPRTLIILVTSAPSRLPATLRSRCQRIRVEPPPAELLAAWCAKQGIQGDLALAAEILGVAPLSWLDADLATMAQVYEDTARALESLEREKGDPASLAERWSRNEFALRLACAETWITRRIRLSADDARRNIARALFGKLDGLRALRRELDAPTNKSVGLESWLWMNRG